MTHDARTSKKGPARSRAKGQQTFAFARKVRRKSRSKSDNQSQRRGRRARADRVGFMAHRARPEHCERHPVHVSMKRVRLGPSLREERVRNAIVRMIARAVERGVRVTQYSIQRDHLHLIVEADDKKTLARGLQWLFSRIAFAVNAMTRRSGSLFRDRHHRRALSTPTEVRRALVYVLFNSRKHDAESILSTEELHDAAMSSLDDCSSAMWLDARDWHPDPKLRPSAEQLARLRRELDGERDFPIHRPSTWLGAIGWKRAGGPLRLNEVPRVTLG